VCLQTCPEGTGRYVRPLAAKVATCPQRIDLLARFPQSAHTRDDGDGLTMTTLARVPPASK